MGALLAAFLLAACQQAGIDAAPVRDNQVAARDGRSVDDPALTGRVVDNAGLLSPEVEARLTAVSADLERRTSDQLVIVTVPSLAGRSIEDYARDLGNRWGIGQADRDNGVLLLVAPAERRVRIAVGYGLESILTTDRASAIINRDLLPNFGEGRFETGVSTGVDSIAATLIAHASEPRRGQP